MNQGEMREYNDKLTAAKQELNEMREMKREHQSDLREARDQLDTAQQDLGKLRKEKEDLIREHQDALGAAENRTAIAKKKIIELEEQQSYKQLILGERVIKLEKEVDLARKNRDALDGAYEAAEKKIAKLKREKADLMQNHRDSLATAEERIAELKMEKVDSIQEHQDALATAEEAAEERIADLEKEKAELIQKHRDALAAAEDRAIVVLERITKPEKEKVGLI
jgi:chromosome segregation ATPase